MRPPSHFRSQQGVQGQVFQSSPRGTIHRPPEMTIKMHLFLWEKDSLPIQRAVFLSSPGESPPGDQRSENTGLGAKRHLWPWLNPQALETLHVSPGQRMSGWLPSPAALSRWQDDQTLPLCRAHTKSPLRSCSPRRGSCILKVMLLPQQPGKRQRDPAFLRQEGRTLALD